MFKYISIEQSTYLIINLFIYYGKLFIEYPCIICYLLIIDMDLLSCQKHLGVFLKNYQKKFKP